MSVGALYSCGSNFYNVTCVAEYSELSFVLTTPCTTNEIFRRFEEVVTCNTGSFCSVPALCLRFSQFLNIRYIDYRNSTARSFTLDNLANTTAYGLATLSVMDTKFHPDTKHIDLYGTSFIDQSTFQEIQSLSSLQSLNLSTVRNIECCQVTSINNVLDADYQCVSSNGYDLINMYRNPLNSFKAGGCVCGKIQSADICRQFCSGYFFDKNLKLCTPCPAGSQCADGNKTVCPIGTFSYKESDSCQKCRSLGCQEGHLSCDSATGKFSSCSLCAQGFQQISLGNGTVECVEQVCDPIDNSALSIFANPYFFDWPQHLKTATNKSTSQLCPSGLSGFVYRVCLANEDQVSDKGLSSVFHKCQRCYSNIDQIENGEEGCSVCTGSEIPQCLEHYCDYDNTLRCATCNISYFPNHINLYSNLTENATIDLNDDGDNDRNNTKTICSPCFSTCLTCLDDKSCITCKTDTAFQSVDDSSKDLTHSNLCAPIQSSNEELILKIGLGILGLIILFVVISFIAYRIIWKRRQEAKREKAIKLIGISRSEIARNQSSLPPSSRDSEYQNALKKSALLERGIPRPKGTNETSTLSNASHNSNNGIPFVSRVNHRSFASNNTVNSGDSHQSNFSSGQSSANSVVVPKDKVNKEKVENNNDNINNHDNRIANGALSHGTHWNDIVEENINDGYFDFREKLNLEYSKDSNDYIQPRINGVGIISQSKDQLKNDQAKNECCDLPELKNRDEFGYLEPIFTESLSIADNNQLGDANNSDSSVTNEGPKDLEYFDPSLPLQLKTSASLEYIDPSSRLSNSASVEYFDPSSPLPKSASVEYFDPRTPELKRHTPVNVNRITNASCVESPNHSNAERFNACISETTYENVLCDRQSISPQVIKNKISNTSNTNDGNDVDDKKWSPATLSLEDSSRNITPELEYFDPSISPNDSRNDVNFINEAQMKDLESYDNSLSPTSVNNLECNQALGPSELYNAPSTQGLLSSTGKNKH